MKQWTLLAAAVCFLLTFSACTNNNNPSSVDQTNSGEQMDSMVEQVQSSFDSTTTAVGDSINRKTERAGDKIDSLREH